MPPHTFHGSFIEVWKESDYTVCFYKECVFVAKVASSTGKCRKVTIFLEKI
jgi:hypothetical protein